MVLCSFNKRSECQVRLRNAGLALAPTTPFYRSLELPAHLYGRNMPPESSEIQSVGAHEGPLAGLGAGDSSVLWVVCVWGRGIEC